MNQLKSPEKGYERRVRARVVRLFGWCGAWAVATALMAFGPKFFWNRNLEFTLLALALNVAVGAGMLLANKGYIEELDDLQRKVQLNSLAITAGVALILGIPYSILDSYHLVPFHAEIPHLLMLMSLVFVVCNLYGTRRYR